MISKENLNSVREFVIDNGIDKAVSKAKRQLLLNNDDGLFRPLLDEWPIEVLNVALKLNTSRWKRKQRLSDRVEGSILSGEAYFLTLTFSDETMARTTEKTRRAYVSRFLRLYCFNYAANIDYGNDGKKRTYTDDAGLERESTAREHYHAVVTLNSKMDFKKWHRYGCIKAVKVRASEKSNEGLTRYLTKLTNHAFKVGSGNPPRLIYSRGYKRALDAFLADPPF